MANYDAQSQWNITHSTSSPTTPAIPSDLAASQALTALLEKKIHRKETSLFPHERQLLDLYISTGAGSSTFTEHHVKAVHTALSSNLTSLVEVLLHADTSYKLLSSELGKGIIHELIKLDKSKRAEWAGNVKIGENWALKILDVMLEHGAEVDSVDEGGDSALYLCCRMGNSVAFERLVASGANFWSLHKRFPLRSGGEGGKVNLLEIAMFSELYKRENEPLQCFLSSTNQQFDNWWGWKWFPITEFLINAGLPFESSHPTIVRYGQAACFQGKLELAKSLLQIEEMRKGCAVSSFFEGFILPSALYSAVIGAQKHVITWLLEIGANGAAKYPETNLDLPLGLTFKELFGDDHPKSVLSRAVWYLNYCRWPKDFDFTPVAECCEFLVEVGAEEKDCEAFLEQCVKDGYLETTKRLLERGIRLEKVPMCENLDEIRVLLDYGIPMDAKEFQIYAIRGGHLKLTKFLVARDGPLVTGNELSRIACSAVHMLECLITDFGLDINEPYGEYEHYPDRKTLILAKTVGDCGSPDIVLKLMELGADPALPGLPSNGVEVLVNSMERYHLEASLFCQKFFPVLRAMGSSNKLADFPRLPWPGEEAEVRNLSLRQRTRSNLTSLETSEPGHKAESLESQNICEPNSKKVGKIDEILIQSVAIDIQEILLNVAGSLYHYQTLSFPDSIRLLELQPSRASDEPVRCRLIHSSISHGVSYEVLSGHWGDGSRRVPILLSGQTHTITDELDSALRRVRLIEKPRILWIQSVCINVNDLKERNDQIAMLRDIHMTSRRLLIWLGDTTNDSDLLIRYIQETELIEPATNPWSTMLHSAGAHRPMVKSEEAEGGTQYAPSMKAAYEKFCRRPWFYRAWSVPEMSLCKAMTVYCGEESDVYSPSVEHANMKNLLQKMAIPYPRPPEQNTTFMSYDENKTVNGPAYVKWLSDLGNIDQNWSWNNSSHFLESWNGGSPLYGHVFRMHDPQDLVFASLALHTENLFPVNYGRGVTDQFCSMTRSMLEKDVKLDLLNTCGRRKNIPNLPSWVPDYTSTDPIILLSSDTRSSRKAFPEVPGPKFNGAELTLNGFQLEAIHALGKELRFEYIPGSREFQRILGEWERMAAELETNKRFPNAITDAFLVTLIGEEWKDFLGGRPIVSYHCANFMLWYREYGTGILRQCDGSYFNEIAVAEHWVKAFQRPQHYITTAEAIIEKYDRDMRDICSGRRFFTTEGGNMGLAPVGAKKGDLVVFFPCGSMPFPFPFVVGKGEDGTWVLRGSCYLYDWDVTKRSDDGELEVKEFLLR